MNSTKLILFKNHLTTFSWFVLFGTLSVSKGLQNFAEIAIIILSLDKLFTSNLKQILKENKPIFAFLFFYILLIIGLLYSENQKEALTVIRHNHRWLVIPIIFLLNKDIIIKHFRSFLKAFIIVTAIASLITVILYFLPVSFTEDFANKLPFTKKYTDYAHRSAFGIYSPFLDRLQFSNLIGISILTLIFSVVKKWIGKSYLILLLPLLVCLIVLGGRGGQLSFLISSVLYMILLYRAYLHDRIKAKFGNAIAVIGITIIIAGMISSPLILLKVSKSFKSRYNQLIWEVGTYQDETYKNYDYVHFTSIRRLISYQHLWEVYKENWAFGVGTGDLNDELKVIYNSDDYVFPVNVHSHYLYLLGILGIPGFLSFFLGWLIILRALRANKEIFRFALVFSVFTLVGMLTDAILIKQIEISIFIVIFSFLWVLVQKEIKESSNMLS